MLTERSIISRGAICSSFLAACLEEAMLEEVCRRQEVCSGGRYLGL